MASGKLITGTGGDLDVFFVLVSGYLVHLKFLSCPFLCCDGEFKPPLNSNGFVWNWSGQASRQRIRIVNMMR
jgi:hypothetical protein